MSPMISRYQSNLPLLRDIEFDELQLATVIRIVQQDKGDIVNGAGIKYPFIYHQLRLPARLPADEEFVLHFFSLLYCTSVSYNNRKPRVLGFHPCFHSHGERR